MRLDRRNIRLSELQSANDDSRRSSTQPAAEPSSAASFATQSDSETPPNAKDLEYVPPDGGYGWVCVLCVFLVNTHAWGLNFAYGVFLDYFLAENLYPGATALDYALIGGLSVSMSLVVTPVINISTRKFGTRATLTIGLVLMTMSLIGASFARKTWHLYLSQGVCFGWGLGFLYVGSANIIPQWFSTKRSLANGIAASGAGFGGLIYSLSSSALLQKAGPPTTFRVLAICQFVAQGIAIALMKSRNEKQQPNHDAFNYRLLGRFEVWLLVGWGCLSELGYTVLLFSLPNYARSVGLTAHQGSIVVSLLNLSLFLARPMVGYTSDTLGRINNAFLTTGVCGIICLVIWIFAKSFGLLCFFALLAGTVCGTFWATVAPVIADVAGLSEVPSTLSIILVCMVLPTTFAEAIGLALRRPNGDIYLDAQVFAGCMFLAASLCNLLLRGWQIGKAKAETSEKRERECEDIEDGVDTHVQPQSLATGNDNRAERVGVAVKRLFELERV
ncbi:MAG: hypothetical protein Q9162_000098 [Coniocarpon cinnabarinum]